MTESFYVDGCLIEPRLNRVNGSNEVFHLEPKIMQVLLFMVKQQGDVVTREEILASVWADTVVGEEVISRSISTLRKVFGDNPRTARVIETIPKVGYRLIAPVSFEETQGDRIPEPTVSLHIEIPQPAKVPDQKKKSKYSLALLLVLVAAGASWMTHAFVGSTAFENRQTLLLTSFPGQEFSPALSPDGNQVAFVWTGAEQGHIDIYTKIVGTETPLQLTNTVLYEYSPAWSPDGSQIAFARSLEGIFVVPALGGPERKLTHIEASSRPDLDWSPKGNFIAFTDRETPKTSHRIYLISPESYERQLLTEPGSFQSDHAPVFSPDGLTVAFVRINSETSDIYSVSLKDKTVTRLTFDHMDIEGLTWTIDGENLIFSSNRGGTYGLWKIPALGGKPEPVSLGGSDLKEPSIGRQNGRMVYTQSTVETNIWRLNIGGALQTHAKPFISSTRKDINSKYSPDGKHIAFLSSRSGHMELWMCDSNGKDPVQLTTIGGTEPTGPHWSPDGKRIAFTSGTAGQADVYIVEVDGGLPRRLTHNPSTDFVSGWSHDGQWLYFGSNRLGDWDLWKTRISDGETMQVTEHGGFYGHESPDGKWVYYSKRQQSGLWRRPTHGGPSMLVLDQLAPLDWGNWVFANNDIYFVNRTNKKPSIDHYDVATGEINTIAIPPKAPYWYGPSLTISPDGRVILYAQLDHSSLDLILSELVH